MPCLRCLADPKPPHFGDPRKCAFDSLGWFQERNWNCATIDALFDAAGSATYETGTVHDETVHVIPAPAALDDYGPCGFLVLTRYKHRGRTSAAVRVGDFWPPEALSLDEAERWIEAFRRVAAGRAGGGDHEPDAPGPAGPLEPGLRAMDGRLDPAPLAEAGQGEGRGEGGQAPAAVDPQTDSRPYEVTVHDPEPAGAASIRRLVVRGYERALMRARGLVSVGPLPVSTVRLLDGRTVVYVHGRLDAAINQPVTALFGGLSLPAVVGVAAVVQEADHG